MKSLLVIVFFIIASFYGFGQQHGSKIICNYQNVAFTDFISDISAKSGIRIYYHFDSFKDQRISLTTDSVYLETALTQATKGLNVNLTWWNGSIVITHEKVVFTIIPDFLAQTSTSQSLTYSDDRISETEKKYLTGRRPDAVRTITVGKKTLAQNGHKAKVRGRVKDDDSGEPIIGATLYIEETGLGVASDYNGFFSLALKPGVYNARFDCLGQKSAIYILDIQSDGEFTVDMEKSVLQLDEVVVYGDKSMSVITRDAGLEKIPIKTLKELPMLMGERDIVKVSELLPGIVSVGEGTSGINVRGGNSDQNGFYINKIPIYNTSHVFGFFPAFNPDIVKDFSIYKGHIPAEYGGRISSVFNIIARQGNRKRFNVRGGINPITSNLTAEGPIIKDAGSVMLSVRSSYSDWILSRIDDPTIRNSKARFNDFAFGLNFDPSAKNQFGVFTYYSSDNFKLSDINHYDYSNFGASADWRHTFSPSTRSELSIITSQYSFGTIDMNAPSLWYEHNYRISHYETRFNISHLLNDKNRIEGGLIGIGYDLNRGVVKPYGNESLRNPVNLGTEKGFEGTLYVSDTYDPFSWLNIYLGLRYSGFAPLGERTVYSYYENQPRDFRYIADTLLYSNLQPIKWYHGPEVRASVNFKTDAKGSVKFAFNQTRQNLFMLNNTVTIAPNTQWKLADAHLQPSVGKQLSFGIFRDFPKLNSEASVEVFGKTIAQITEFKDGASFTETAFIETIVLQGEQKAYGVELMLRKSTGRFNGWIAYTYSRSLIQVDGDEFWMKINEGDIYASNYDIPHSLNVVANYRFSRRFNFSTTTTYQKGRPVTYPLSVYYIDGIPVIEYSKRNEFRIPDYFRVDVSLAVEGNLKKKKLFHSSWMFGVYNATGRKNPLSIYFKSEDGKIKGYKYSIIGVPVFTVTWLFKLGNYASD